MDDCELCGAPSWSAATLFYTCVVCGKNICEKCAAQCSDCGEMVCNLPCWIDCRCELCNRKKLDRESEALLSMELEIAAC